ncbi:DUF3106 domain-containing protein [Uliginosibacterium sp. sgz301328]|uniref:DUF3106 domain-containing protein n=1 Tax=Uliginosibacterium sp. sgz301328 TaxID=3243764 RepID=UPI00359CEB54
MAAKLRRALIGLAMALCCVGAQSASTPASTPQPAAWRSLTHEQKALLAPLAGEWDDFTPVRQRKWLGIANRYPTMTSQEQAKLRSRVADWAKLTHEEREAARAQFKKIQAQQTSDAPSLQEQWLRYDALPAHEKEKLKQAPRTLGTTTNPLKPLSAATAHDDKTPVQSGSEPPALPSDASAGAPKVANDTPAATP